MYESFIGVAATLAGICWELGFFLLFFYMQDHNSRFSALCAVRTLCSRGKHRCISDRAGAEGLKRLCFPAAYAAESSEANDLDIREQKRKKKKIKVYP